MEKAKRQSMLGIQSSLSVSPTRLVGSVLNEASHESQMAMSGSSSYNSNRNSMRLSSTFEKRHSRTPSRSNAGHGRGHSRTGSISISQNALAEGVMAAALGHISQKASLSPARPLSTHIANTTHSHTRGHSRSGSRSLAASRSRPTSILGPKQDKTVWKDEAISSAEDLFKTPTMNVHSFTALDTDASPQQRAFNPSVPTTSVIQATPILANSNHARRPSRHARKGSVSTRRESMEIMGGLTTQDNNRQSRRISTNRWSGLQSASVLFGGGNADFAMFDRRRGSDENGSDDEGGDRLTTLEKLEGKRQRDSLKNSVQLPSFDDVHGDEAMDKRASLHLLEANAQTTSAERSSALVDAPVARPLTMIEPNKDLCSVIEEEEEEEDGSVTSPVNERSNIDFIDEEEKRRRKEAEQEVIKRNRRGSLTPRPLKLKSRPASLFVAPRSARLTASNSFPDLDLSVEEEQEEEEEKEEQEEGKKEAMPATVTPITPAQSTPTWNSALRPLQTTTPSKETKRAWRSSMPLAVNRSPSQPTNTTSPSSTSASSRQGMRALRLGSTSSTAPSLVRQHKNHTDSVSSLNSTFSSSSAAFSMRGSLLYNASPASSRMSKEDVSPLSKKRGSLLYKSSPLDAASNTSADISIHSTIPASAPASTTATAIGGVPLGLFEELKSKYQRDVVLLDDARSKIARLEGELASESERRTQELAEYERWSAEEKRSLAQRIEHLEASIVQVVQVRDAKELSLTEEREKLEEDLTKIKGDFEDVEAERDMLREDEDGWRTRCSDLEKSLKIERRVNDDLKRIKVASRQRIRELLGKLHEAGVQVEHNSVDEEEISSELIAALKSPPAGPSSPPSDVQRDGSVSPLHADANQLPPPQAVQLLKDMRQQIFNLAGSLEHERKQHLVARQEVEEMKASMSRLKGRSPMDETENTTLNTMDSLQSTPERASQQDRSPSTSTPPHPSSLGSPVKSTKVKRNHVFAYDSSMESGFESSGMGSGSMTTYQTSHDDDDMSLQAKDDESFVAKVQGDLAGLGMGTLGTVEEEEAGDSPGEESKASPRESFDIEAGRRASDSDSVAPPTPALEHASLPPPVASNTKEHTSVKSSASSSQESHGPPSPLAQTSSGGSSSQGKTATLNDYADDLYEDDGLDNDDALSSAKDRPEFIREWSFQQAAAAVKKASPRKRPTVVTNGLRKKNRPMSIEDFFGIMTLDENEKLPALPTPTEALEMPPLYIEDKGLAYGGSPRYPSSIRAPVPRSSAMYARSMSDRSSSSSSQRSSPYKQRIAAQTQYLPGNDSGYTPAAAVASIGGGMFSRVASLTSAFSGYLIGNATNEYDSRNDTSNSWAVTKREEEIV
jgi:hypothetical protein